MAEVTHEDIFLRIQEAEKDIVILDTKVDRVLLDVSGMRKDIKRNGDAAREVGTQVRTTGRMVVVFFSAISVLLALANYIGTI